MGKVIDKGPKPTSAIIDRGVQRRLPSKAKED
jgi:hypothetical protein